MGHPFMLNGPLVLAAARRTDPEKPRPPVQKIPITSLPYECFEPLEDWSGTIGELHAIVQGLRTTHGDAATLYFDAGHNNVACHIVTVQSEREHRLQQKDIATRNLTLQERKEITMYKRLHKKFANIPEAWLQD